MAKVKKKIWLIHGDCDYLIFKELKTIKKNLLAQNISISELFGARGLHFDEIRNALGSSDLFLNSSAIIVRDLTDSRSFFPFVEELVEFIKKSEPSENELYLISFSKILKTSKLYKAINEVGEIKEINQPKPAEIQDMIRKSMNISNEATHLLMQFTNSNLFQIKNEIEKLKSYLSAKEKEKADASDIEEICVKTFSQNDVWGIGSKYLTMKLEICGPKTSATHHKPQANLMKEVDDLLLNNVPVMQILYSFYQNVLSAIKFRVAMDEGKINSERDAFSYGYFFVKEFYSKRNLMKFDELMKWNSEILSVEYSIKSGEMDDVLGLKRLIINQDLHT